MMQYMVYLNEEIRTVVAQVIANCIVSSAVTNLQLRRMGLSSPPLFGRQVEEVCAESQPKQWNEPTEITIISQSGKTSSSNIEQ